MRFLTTCLTLFAAAIFPACGGEEAAEKVEALSVLRVGILPSEAPDVAHVKYSRLLDLVTADSGIHYELTIPDDYEALIDLFCENQLDLVKFGGYSFALACERMAVVPLVQRDLDTRFTSYFIVKGDDDSDTLRDFQGETFSFAARLSTSGHLMPRAYLNDQGIDPENFFGDVHYSGAHDRTVQLVCDGEVDLAAVDAQIYDAMLEAGTITTSDVRILVETPPYANYVWALHPSVPEGDVIRIRDGFLGLSARNEEDREVLTSLGASTYLPAHMAEYTKLRELARKFQEP